MNRKSFYNLLIVFFAALFLFSLGMLVRTQMSYRKGADTYARAVQEYVLPAETAAVETREASASGRQETASPQAGAPTEPEEAVCPISVDFEKLRAANPDVMGWIYCEGTQINYPVVQRDNNEYYLNHLIDGSRNASGTIFVECENTPDLADANTIIYGHHMRNGSMFAELLKYSDQDFYEEHPVMWLLTPQKNWQVVLFSAYATALPSDAYMIYYGPGPELADYVRRCAGRSDFRAHTAEDPAEQEKFVVLSTCEYSRADGRYVVHGYLR